MGVFSPKTSALPPNSWLVSPQEAQLLMLYNDVAFSHTQQLTLVCVHAMCTTLFKLERQGLACMLRRMITEQQGMLPGMFAWDHQSALAGLEHQDITATACQQAQHPWAMPEPTGDDVMAGSKQVYTASDHRTVAQVVHPGLLQLIETATAPKHSNKNSRLSDASITPPNGHDIHFINIIQGSATTYDDVGAYLMDLKERLHIGRDDAPRQLLGRCLFNTTQSLTPSGVAYNVPLQFFV